MVIKTTIYVINNLNVRKTMHAIVCKYNHSPDRGYTQNTKVAITYASIYHWLYLLIKSKRKNDDSLRTNIFLQTYRISYRNKFFQKEFNLRLYEGLKEKKMDFNINSENYLPEYL